MKKQLALFVVLVIVSGCVGAQVVAPQDRLNKVKKIALVPMESPPLEIPPFVSTDSLFASSAIMATVPVESIQETGRIGVMIFGIFMLAQLPEEIKRSSEAAESFEAILDSGEAWIPTVVFAREAANQITAQKKYNVVIQGVQKFTEIKNRDRTWHGENWHASIRSWYNQTKSLFDYGLLRNQGCDVVLEVGIFNYMYIETHIGLSVWVRLIDLETDQLLGRSRAYDQPYIGNGEQLLANKGKRFKDLFGALGARLVNENLQSIGLIPK
ncbi:MAG: hypothetical protein V3W20_05810 [Candidatus Neomarinimicrobiota bacterium]